MSKVQDFNTSEATDAYIQSGLVKVMSEAITNLAAEVFSADNTKPLSKQTILDFGSGAGFNAFALLRAGAGKVVLANTAKTMLDRAEKLMAEADDLDETKTSTIVISQNPHELAQELPQEVDSILAAFVLHYIPEQDIGAIVSELGHSMKPGGRMLVTDIPAVFGIGPGSRILAALDAESTIQVTKHTWHWNRVPWSAFECVRILE
jgi:SAM-dependent methyltransferase